MADELKRTTFEAILKPDPRVKADNIWAAESSYTQQGLRPGGAVPQQVTSMALLTSGGMPASDDVRVRCNRGGHPGLDGAGIVFRGEADSDYYGDDVPNIITGQQVMTAGWSSSADYTRPDAEALDDGSVFVVYDRVTTETQVRRIIRDTDGLWPGSGGGGDDDIYDPNVVTDYPTYPTVCRINDDEIIVFHWVEYPGGSSGALSNIWAWISEDRGVTFQILAKDVLPEGLLHSDWTLDDNRLRARYKDGQILLLMGLQHPSAAGSVIQMSVIRQYASNNGGASFDYIDEFDGTLAGSGGGSGFDIRVWRGEFHISYVAQNSNDGSTRLRHRTLASAYDKITDGTLDVNEVVGAVSGWAATTNVAGTYYTIDARTADTALVAHHGRLWLYSRRHGDSAKRHAVFYTEDGKTWISAWPSGSTESNWYRSQATAVYLLEFTAVSHRGRVLMAAVTSAGYPDNLIALSLGGWSTVNMPRNTYIGRVRTKEQTPWQDGYLCQQVPESSGWTAGGTGTGVINSGAYLRIDTSGAASQRYYTRTPSMDEDRGLILLFEAQLVVAGTTAPGTNRVGVDLLIGDGAVSYNINVSVEAASLTVNDPASANSVTSSTTRGDARFQMLIGMVGDSGGGSGAAYAWARAVGTDSDEPLRQWEALGSVTIADSGAFGDSITFGHIAGSVDAQRSHWWRVSYSYSEEYISAPHLSAGQTNPDDLYAQAVGDHAVDLLDGLQVRAESGPAYTTQIWTIGREWEYGVANILVNDEPNPEVYWRSVNSTVTQQLAWDLSSPNVANSLIGETVAVWAKNANMKELTVEGYNQSTTTWDAVGTLDFAEGLNSLDFVRTGNVVRPGASATGSRWIHRGELAGATFNLGSNVLRRIIWNDSGIWGPPDSYKRVRLYLADVTHGSDPTSGSGGEIWCTRGVFYKHYNSSTGVSFRGYRVTATGSATATIDGYFQAKLAIGPIIPLGWRPSDGMTRRFEPNNEITTYRGGGRTVIEAGPMRRTITMAWVEAIPQIEIHRTSADVEWFSNVDSSGYPWGSRYETPTLISGLVEELQGMKQLVVVLPLVWGKVGSTDDYVDTRFNSSMLARLAGPVEITTQLQKPQVSESVSVATVRWDEEVG